MIDSIVDNLSKTTAARRDELFRWLAKQGEATRIELVKLQGDLAAQHRPQYDKARRTDFFYSMQVLALAKMHWAETAQAQKTTLSTTEAAELTARRTARIKAITKRKASPKKELIRVRFFEEIKRLKAESLSWRQIALYIKTYHKISFAFGYLRNTFEVLEKEKKEIEA